MGGSYMGAPTPQHFPPPAPPPPPDVPPPPPLLYLFVLLSPNVKPGGEGGGLWGGTDFSRVWGHFVGVFFCCCFF